MVSEAAGTPICITLEAFQAYHQPFLRLYMPISVRGGPGVGFHTSLSHVNMKSKENQSITYKAIKRVCVCAPFMYCLCFSFCVCTNMHVRMCLDKIKTGPKEMRGNFVREREADKEKGGDRERK